jgi:hypothetical protein
MAVNGRPLGAILAAYFFAPNIKAARTQNVADDQSKNGM